MTTKIERSGCSHERHDARCVWCVARRRWPGRVEKVVANRDDGYAFVTVTGQIGNVMFEEGAGGEWRESRPNFSNAL